MSSALHDFLLHCRNSSGDNEVLTYWAWTDRIKRLPIRGLQRGPALALETGCRSMPRAVTPTMPAPDLRLVTASDGSRRLELSGAWNLQSLERKLAELKPKLADYAADPASNWDLRGIEIIDHAGAMLLWRAWGRRRAANLVLKPEHELLFSHLDLPAVPPPRGKPRGGGIMVTRSAPIHYPTATPEV